MGLDMRPKVSINRTWPAEKLGLPPAERRWGKYNGSFVAEEHTPIGSQAVDQEANMSHESEPPVAAAVSVQGRGGSHGSQNYTLDDLLAEKTDAIGPSDQWEEEV